MSIYWNTRIKNISPYVPGEQPKGQKIIKLNTNENPYPPSEKVIEAVKKAACENLRLYPDPECIVFRKAVAEKFNVKIEQVFAGNGSDEVLAFAFGAFFENAADKPLLFPDITYSFYPAYADLWSIPYRTIALRDDFTINTEDYKTGCCGAILPNPNAPTSIALALDDILSLAKFFEEQKKVFIVDEAYIAFGGSSLIPYINDYPNLLVIHTLSKSESLAGLRAGFAIGNEKLMEGLCRIRDSFNSYTLDHLALAGAAAAISDAAYYKEINSRVIATRERIAKEFCDLGFTVLPSSANFLFVKNKDIGGAKLFAALRERGIIVRHFNRDRIADYLRVSIGTDEQMDTVINACREILNENNKQR
ncbi:MAG: histidinol-phosphate transaminase [Treponema sp.]|nr:histidinol-phosphate transaminase [Treponema sp.]